MHAQPLGKGCSGSRGRARLRASIGGGAPRGVLVSSDCEGLPGPALRNRGLVLVGLTAVAHVFLVVRGLAGPACYRWWGMLAR